MYTFCRAREVQLYQEFKALRLKAHAKNPKTISKEYLSVISQMIQAERNVIRNGLEVACEFLNSERGVSRPVNFTPMHIEKFLEISQARDENFAKVHTFLKKGIQEKKPANYVPAREAPLTLPEARKAYFLRKKLVEEFTTKMPDYKELVEEVYLLIISKADQGEELEEKKQQALFQSIAIKSKANDAVTEQLGFDELMLEDSIKEFGLEE
mmetsp:Transcript_16000/g.24810  ORF Transcript_16000/g.24810 Transcript_16000/m.24810 type:complete len:211 (+) Transcript_16000:218-850(+)